MDHATLRHLTPFDRLLDGAQTALSAVFGSPLAERAYPGDDVAEADMDERERRTVAGLMRINHTGEVCAQALYQGQALLARDADTARHLHQAASEETDHLAWCGSRLQELGARPSLLNPFWYAGSYAIGVAAAATSDRISLGFVMETEHQVEAHLAEHIDRLPPQDERSRAVLKQMQADEIRHADNAEQRGGVPLPGPVPMLMRLTSKIMKATAYRI